MKLTDKTPPVEEKFPEEELADKELRALDDADADAENEQFVPPTKEQMLSEWELNQGNTSMRFVIAISGHLQRVVTFNKQGQPVILDNGSDKRIATLKRLTEAYQIFEAAVAARRHSMQDQPAPIIQVPK